MAEVKHRVRAVIISNLPSDIRTSGFKRYEYGNYRVMELNDDGRQQILVNGSVNGTDADVGDQGWAVYKVGPSSGLWYFIPDKLDLRPKRGVES